MIAVCVAVLATVAVGNQDESDALLSARVITKQLPETHGAAVVTEKHSYVPDSELLPKIKDVLDSEWDSKMNEFLDSELEPKIREVLENMTDEFKGEQGDSGDDGRHGNHGVDGENGEKGDSGVNGNHGTDGQNGAKGDKGDQGNDGVDGENGEKGDSGVNGNHGIDGQNGAKGDKGDQGNDGMKGDKGDAGLPSGNLWAVGIAPKGYWEENKGCPSGYAQITDVETCKIARNAIQPQYPWHGTAERDIRPMGCFRHARSNLLVFNPIRPTKQMADPGDGGDTVICKIQNEYAVGIAPQGYWEENKGCPRGYAQITDVETCQHARNAIQSQYPWYGTAERDSRPMGCFRHHGNNLLCFNPTRPTKQMADPGDGGDTVICKSH